VLSGQIDRTSRTSTMAGFLELISRDGGAFEPVWFVAAQEAHQVAAQVVELLGIRIPART
jgi:hypothetical protein